MKRVMLLIQVTAVVAALISVTAMGFEIYTHMNPDYIIAEAYIIGICLVVNAACAVYRAFSSKCPHCGKMKLENGKYCAHCGKEV